MNAEQLKPKAIKASERFLESRGYEILETSWECASGGADIIARLALSAAELPIGVVTATLGAPVFIWLLLRSGRRG